MTSTSGTYGVASKEILSEGDVVLGSWGQRLARGEHPALTPACSPMAAPDFWISTPGLGLVGEVLGTQVPPSPKQGHSLKCCVAKDTTARPPVRQAEGVTLTPAFQAQNCRRSARRGLSNPRALVLHCAVPALCVQLSCAGDSLTPGGHTRT